MARTIKLRRKVSDNKGKNAFDIEKNKKRIAPGEGGALDPNDPLLKDDEGYYTLVDRNKGLKAGVGKRDKYKTTKKGKSAR